MKRLFTLLFLVAITSSVMAQKNGQAIRKVNKDLTSTLKNKVGNQSKKPSLKLRGNEKFPGTIARFDWIQMTNEWEFTNTSELSYRNDGQVANEMLVDDQQNVIGRINYTYNSNNKLTEQLMEIQMAPNVFVPYMANVFNYNTEGDLTLSESKMWVNNAWEITYGDKYEIEYNLILGTKTTIESYWNGAEYDTSMKRIERYTNNILTIEEEYQFTGTEFIAIDQYEYLFDANGVDTGMLKRLWNGTNWQEDELYCNYIWENSSKDFLVYNNVFLRVGAEWRLYEREQFTRDNFGSFSYLLEDYQNGIWVGNMRIQSINNSHKARTLYLYDLYLNGAWQELFRIEEEYAYDTDDNETLHIYKESDSNGQLNNIYKEESSNFITISGVSNTKNKALGFYPNPTADFIIIKDEKLVGEKYVLTDLSGKIIQTGKVEEDLKIDISRITNGMYIIAVDNYQAKVQLN